MAVSETVVRIRERTNLEAVDLGLVLLRRHSKVFYFSWLLFSLPFFLGIFFLLQRQIVWAFLVLWWLKPLYERITLFFASRLVFNRKTSFGDFIQLFPAFALKGLFADLLWRRFLPFRSFLTPIHLLEGSARYTYRRRVGILGAQGRGCAAALTIAGFICEIALYFGWFVIFLLFSSREVASRFYFTDSSTWANLLRFAMYYFSISLIGPFYVTGGFFLYINRRVFLEGWDIEIVFRGLAARLKERLSGSALIILAVFLLALAVPAARAEENLPANFFNGVSGEIKTIMESDELNKYEERWVWQQKNAKLPQSNQQPAADLLHGPSPFDYISANALQILLISGLVFFLIFVVSQRFLTRRGAHRGRETDSAAQNETEIEYLRPEKLSGDIVQRALAAWAEGMPTAALSLIYCGSLAYFVYRKKILIPHSATERDCSRLLAAQLTADSAGKTMVADFAALIRLWQYSAYAHRKPDQDSFAALCTTWDYYFKAEG